MMKNYIEGIYIKIAIITLAIMTIGVYVTFAIFPIKEVNLPITAVEIGKDIILERDYYLDQMTVYANNPTVGTNQVSLKAEEENKQQVLPIQTDKSNNSAVLIENQNVDEGQKTNVEKQTKDVNSVGQVSIVNTVDSVDITNEINTTKEVTEKTEVSIVNAVSTENEVKEQNEVNEIKELNEEEKEAIEEKETKEVNELKVENKQQNAKTKEKEAIMQKDLNSYVLDVIKTYPIGLYPYLLNNDFQNYNGVTTNINYKGKLLLKAHPSGNRASHCSGITFEVFYKAMQKRNKEVGISTDDFNGMTYNQLYDFVLIWYVATGNKSSNNIATAMEKYGVGKEISNFEDARAGDFIDFSRENNTGHTGVFIKWIRDNGKIVGVRYWSSQNSTKGINYKEEYFNIQKRDGKKYGNLMINQVYIGRVTSINQYK